MHVIIYILVDLCLTSPNKTKPLYDYIKFMKILSCSWLKMLKIKLFFYYI